jgi:hypothetical protein
MFVPSNLDVLKSVLSGHLGMASWQYVSPGYDAASGTLSLAVNFTNPSEFGLTVDSVSANVVDNQDGFSLGHVSTIAPVRIGPNEATLISVNMTLTEDAYNHLASVAAGAGTFDIGLTGVTFDIQGVIIQQAGVTVLNVPMVR